MGARPIVGTLDDAALLATATQNADAFINAASADHLGAITTIAKAAADAGKRVIHTSGSSIVGTRAGGEVTENIFDETTAFTPSPASAARVALNEAFLTTAVTGVHPIIICPALIYGAGRGLQPDSMQAPWLIELARRSGVARHVGPGENIWSNVHIDDLVTLYILALGNAPPGAFYFAENGENSMREVCAAISRMLGLDGRTEGMTADEAASVWGDGPANATMGSNSRVRAVRARAELGWTPTSPSLIEEIATGVYRKSGGV